PHLDLPWRTNYNAGRKEAADIGRPLLLYFCNSGCIHSRKLETTSFNDQEITTLLRSRFVLLTIDDEKEPALAGQLGIWSTPVILLARSDGKIMDRVEGYRDSKELKSLLRRTLSRIALDEDKEQIEIATKKIDQHDFVGA